MHTQLVHVTLRERCQLWFHDGLSGIGYNPADRDRGHSRKRECYPVLGCALPSHLARKRAASPQNIPAIRDRDDFVSVDLDAELLRQQLASTDRIEISAKSRVILSDLNEYHHEP